MQSSNQKCNALQSVVGIFCHSSNTPERVIHMLSHMGISISVNAVHDAVRSLSKETYYTLQNMGQTLLISYGYDNFDIDFKRSVSTVENAVDTLEHLTSGILIELDHGVTLEDLNCSEYLWSKSRLNLTIDQHSIPHPRSCLDLEQLHPEDEDHPTGLTRRERFNAWRFRQDLFHHGPSYFHQFRDSTDVPEEIDQIPVVKMRHAPARSMDINQSKVSGNIEAIQNLLNQGGVGDPDEDLREDQWSTALVSIRSYVVLFHGDLGTMERVQSLLERRSLESTPWRRYQYLIFVMGLFHLKMACADAIWRIFISPREARIDQSSILQLVAIQRPKETGKITSNPGFRKMHEVIGHTGIALRLDCWRVEAEKRDPRCVSLNHFAKTKPSKEYLEAMSYHLAAHYIAGGEVTAIEDLRRNEPAQRDFQRENNLLLHQYLLLYEEMAWAMNHGDIGRIETLFPQWIYLFRATGKHKYGTQMLKFLTDVHFLYPASLRHAVRYNILVNPTGTPGAFRAVDWVVELLNLHTKVSSVHSTLISFSLTHKDTFGGRGSCYTKERVIQESSIIEVYRSCHGNIERNFGITALTSRHTPPDLQKSFAKMAEHCRLNSTHEIVPGRGTAYSIPNMLDKGLHIMLNSIISPADEVEEDGLETHPTIEDVVQV